MVANFLPIIFFIFIFFFNQIFLTSLTLFLLISDFLTTTSPEIYELIPPVSDLVTSPLAFVRTYWDLFGLHLEYTSAVAQEHRQRKNDDVQKRREFRIAHGLEKDLPTPALPGAAVAGGVGQSANEEIVAIAQAQEQRGRMDGDAESGSRGDDVEDGHGRTYKDFEGKTQLAKKKWYQFWS